MFLHNQKNYKRPICAPFYQIYLKIKDVSSKISAALPWQGKSSVLKRAHHRASRLKEIKIA
jgi:hypothetical protein